jgi:hypothetical protein
MDSWTGRSWRSNGNLKDSMECQSCHPCSLKQWICLRTRCPIGCIRIWRMQKSILLGYNGMWTGTISSHACLMASCILYIHACCGFGTSVHLFELLWCNVACVIFFSWTHHNVFPVSHLCLKWMYNKLVAMMYMCLCPLQIVCVFMCSMMYKLHMVGS